MNKFLPVLFLLFSILLIPVIDSADALKSKGTFNSSVRSSEVCGDQLCSAIDEEKPQLPKEPVTSTGEQESDESLSLLFLQTAHSGTFTEIDGKKILTLNDVSSSTVWFADRPQRVTGHQSTDEFIAKWSQGEDSFADDPPNGALEILSGDEESDVFILELMNPIYDSESQTLQYEFILLEEGTQGLQHYTKDADAILPQTFGTVALFIDNANLPVSDCVPAPNKDLSNCDLSGADLSGVDLSSSRFQYTNLKGADLSGANLSHTNFRGAILVDVTFTNTNFGCPNNCARFSSADLSNVDFSGANLKKAFFDDATLFGVNFSGANLMSAHLLDALWRGDPADFTNANILYCEGCPLYPGQEPETPPPKCKRYPHPGIDLTRCDFVKWDLRGVNFRGANLHGADFMQADLRGANFEGAKLGGVIFIGANVKDANFSNTDLTVVTILPDFTDANLSGADLSGRDFTRRDFSGANLDGANLSNTKFSGTNQDLSGVDFTNTNLSRADFSNVDLRGVIFTHADLRDSNLSGADLTGASLKGANLSGLDLSGRDFSGQDLTGANLSGADLTGADFTGANLTGANLRNTNISGANFTSADLTGAKLKGANHLDADFTDAITDGCECPKDKPIYDAKLKKKLCQGQADSAARQGEYFDMNACMNK